MPSVLGQENNTIPRDRLIMKQEIENFYKENFDRLVKIYTRRCHSVDVAEDVVQEAFALALQYQDTFNPHYRGFKQWFDQILLNAFRKRMRDDRMMGMSDELDEEIIEQEDMPLFSLQLSDKIRADMDAKPPHVAEVLNLYFVKGYKWKDIAAVTDYSFKGIDKIIERFKADMRVKYA